jgi:hypothetical protein
VTEGGVAGSMAQVGQRVGTAMGVAAASSIFFATLFREGPGSADNVMVYHDGFRNAFFVALGLLVIALVIGLFDLRRRALEAAAPSADAAAADATPAAAPGRAGADAGPDPAGPPTRRKPPSASR